MPTYEYECRKCKHRFEKFQSITDKPIKTCPKCKARQVVRLIGGGAGIIFKGSGFYQTDYRSDSYRKEAKKDTASKSDSKSDSKTDSKTDKPKAEKKAAKSDAPKKDK